MPTTLNPIIWDTYRLVGPASGVGGVVEYYTTEAQSIFLDAESPGGFQTQTTTVNEGHWEEAEWTETLNINEQGHRLLSLEHPSNGILYGVNVTGNDLWFWRYIYEMDVSDVISNGTMELSNDNAITSLSADVINGDNNEFDSDVSLFLPGSKIELKVSFGDSDDLDLMNAYLDEVDWDTTGETVSVNGRNAIGFLLNDLYYGNNDPLSGISSVVVSEIMRRAGVKDFDVTEGEYSWTYDVKPDTSLLECLEQVKAVFPGFDIIETPSGKIVVGYAELRNRYLQTSTYEFSIGDDCFSRSVRKSMDVAYSKVYISGKGPNGNELTPEVRTIDGWRAWNIPENKIYFETAPDGMTQEKLGELADERATELKLVGVTQDLTGPFRPQLLIGDIAQVTDNGRIVNLGLITSITHHFGVDGFSTDFTVDSGGDNTSNDSRTKALGGFTRRQGMVDLVRVIANKNAGGSGFGFGRSSYI